MRHRITLGAALVAAIGFPFAAYIHSTRTLDSIQEEIALSREQTAAALEDFIEDIRQESPDLIVETVDAGGRSAIVLTHPRDGEAEHDTAERHERRVSAVRRRLDPTFARTTEE